MQQFREVSRTRTIYSTETHTQNMIEGGRQTDRNRDRQGQTDRQTETGRQKQRQQEKQVSQIEIKNTDSHTQQQQNLKRSAFLLL